MSLPSLSLIYLLAEHVAPQVLAHILDDVQGVAQAGAAGGMALRQLVADAEAY